MKLTIKDLREMARMGYTVKAMYRSCRGIPFHKFFRDRAEFEGFTEKAEQAGSRLVGCAERRV